MRTSIHSQDQRNRRAASYLFEKAQEQEESRAETILFTIAAIALFTAVCIVLWIKP